jgi:hypothetical protein
MCPQTPRLSPEYSHKAGLQTVITGMPLQIRPVTRSDHAGPVTMGRITRGPPCWTRSQGGTTSSQVFVRCRMGRRVSLPVVLSPLDQRLQRRHRAKVGVFAFAPTLSRLWRSFRCHLPPLGGVRLSARRMGGCRAARTGGPPKTSRAARAAFVFLGCPAFAPVRRP